MVELDRQSAVYGYPRIARGNQGRVARSDNASGARGLQRARGAPSVRIGQGIYGEGGFPARREWPALGVALASCLNVRRNSRPLVSASTSRAISLRRLARSSSVSSGRFFLGIGP